LVNDGAFLVDVRSPGEFADGNVKGSVNIPLDQVQNQLAKFKDKESIVVFCRSGNRSSQAKSILEQNGFTNVTNGGTWQDVNAVFNK
jgi:rhodanese-related sulfurtransferase